MFRFLSGNKRPAPPSRASSRPQLEHLEGRALPSGLVPMTQLSLGAGQVVRTEQMVIAHELQILDQALALQAAGQRPGVSPPTISGGGAGASFGEPTKPVDGPKDLAEALRDNVDFEVLLPDAGDDLRGAFAFFDRFI